MHRIENNIHDWETTADKARVQQQVMWNFFNGLL